eukprot:2274174-Prymnesium_polylepis.4
MSDEEAKPRVVRCEGRVREHDNGVAHTAVNGKAEGGQREHNNTQQFQSVGKLGVDHSLPTRDLPPTQSGDRGQTDTPKHRTDTEARFAAKR